MSRPGCAIGLEADRGTRHGRQQLECLQSVFEKLDTEDVGEVEDGLVRLLARHVVRHYIT